MSEARAAWEDERARYQDVVDIKRAIADLKGGHYKDLVKPLAPKLKKPKPPKGKRKSWAEVGTNIDAARAQEGRPPLPPRPEPRVYPPPPPITNPLLADALRQAERVLTPATYRVARLMASGFNSVSIAAMLGLKPQSVYQYRYPIQIQTPRLYELITGEKRAKPEKITRFYPAVAPEEMIRFHCPICGAVVVWRVSQIFSALNARETFLCPNRHELRFYRK